VAQLLPPHYSAIRQAESDLGVGPYGWVMDINFVVRGILSLAFAYGLYLTWPKTSKAPRISLALIGVWGIGAFILAINPADVSGPTTIHGTISGVIIAPMFVPELKIPVASARSFFGNHSATHLMLAGKTPASPNPKAERAITNVGRECANGMPH